VVVGGHFESNNMNVPPRPLGPVECGMLGGMAATSRPGSRFLILPLIVTQSAPRIGQPQAS
jgi:hypothetical protein